jgi:hypothetical protein
MYYINILKPLTGLISSALVNDMKYKFLKNIENVNDNRVIKVNIVFKVKLKSSK